MEQEIVTNKSEYINLVLGTLIVYSYNTEQILQIIYTITCVFWLLYAIGVIVYILRKKTILRQGLEYSHYEVEDEIFKIDEKLTRFTIFFIFLVFDCIFCLSANMYLAILLSNVFPVPIPIDKICVSQMDPLISENYEVGIIILNLLFSFENFSFAMMIWVLAVFQLHLSYAARNELKLKQVGQFLLFGLTFNFIVLIFMMVPYTNILGKIAQTIMSVISYFILLYIGRYKCLPALKSGVKEAYRIHSYYVYQKERYLRQYKIIFITLLIAFLIFLVRDLFFYDIFIASESVVMDPCWFNAAYHIHYFNLYVRTIDFLVSESKYLMVLVHSLSLFGYSFFIVIKLTAFSLLVFKFVKMRHNRALVPRVYRLNENQLSTTLLPK